MEAVPLSLPTYLDTPFTISKKNGLKVQDFLPFP